MSSGFHKCTVASSTGKNRYTTVHSTPRGPAKWTLNTMIEGRRGIETKKKDQLIRIKLNQVFRDKRAARRLEQRLPAQ